MRVVAVVLALALASIAFAAATEEVKVPAVLTQQISKIESMIALDTKDCGDAIDLIKANIRKHSEKKLTYDRRIKTIRSQTQQSKVQLAAEIKAISEVESMVMQTASTSSSSSSATASASATVSSLPASSSKLAGVLENIVTSVKQTPTVTVNVEQEFKNVLTLLGNLRASLEQALGADPIIEEIKQIQASETKVQSQIMQLTAHLESTQADCDRRHATFTSVLTVLRLIKTTYSTTSIPDCSIPVSEKDAEIKVLREEIASLKSELAIVKEEAATCKAAHDAACPANLEKCQKDKESAVSEVNRLKTFESEVKTYEKQVTSMQKEVMACHADLAHDVAELETLHQTVKTLNVAAQCTAQHSTIETLNHQVKELHVKVTLGEKCATKYKLVQSETHELRKHLEKMTVIHNQLEQCHTTVSTAAKDCAAKVKEQDAAHQGTITRLTEHIKEMHTAMEQLTNQAACTTERTTITHYEHEVTKITDETHTEIVHVTSEFNQCKAQLQTATQASTEETSKAVAAKARSDQCEEKLSMCKVAHKNCVDTHATAKQQCAGIAAELAQCKTDSSTSLAKLNAIRHESATMSEQKLQMQEIITKLESEETTQRSEIATLTSKVEVETTTITTLTTQVHTLRTEENHLMSIKAEIEKSIADKAAALQAATTKIAELTEKLTVATNDGGAVQAELVKAQAAKEKLYQDNVALNAKLVAAASKLATQTTYRTNAEAQLKDKLAAVSTLNEELHTAEDQVAKKEAARTELAEKVEAMQAQLEENTAVAATLRKELGSCHSAKLELTEKNSELAEKAKCVPHVAALRAMKKNNNTLRTSLKGLYKTKKSLQSEVSGLTAKMATWKAYNDKLRTEVKACKNNHVGCKSTVDSVKRQMLSNLRDIKGHVSSISRLEEKLAGAQTEVQHTKKQWHADRKAFKAFKDNLVEQMARLVSLAKDAKRKFDVSSTALANENKVQDAQFEVCRKETLNYEKMLGQGVVKAAKEQLKANEATQRYVAMRAKALATLSAASAAQKSAKNKAAAVSAAAKVASIARKAAAPAPQAPPAAAPAPKDE